MTTGFWFCRRFEVETVAMTANMLHGDANVVGSVTSGGTESILCAVKAYRDRARHLHPHITHPEMVRYVFNTYTTIWLENLM